MNPPSNRVVLCGMLMRATGKPRKGRQAGSLSAAELVHVLSWVRAAHETMDEVGKRAMRLEAELEQAQGVIQELQAGVDRRNAVVLVGSALRLEPGG